MAERRNVRSATVWADGRILGLTDSNSTMSPIFPSDNLTIRLSDILHVLQTYGLVGESPARQLQHHPWQQPVLLLEHPGGERVGSVIRRYAHLRLRDDGPPVVLLVDVVDRGARDPRPARQHCLVHPAPVHPRPSEGRE